MHALYNASDGHNATFEYPSSVSLRDACFDDTCPMLYADIHGQRRYYAMSLLRIEDSMKAFRVGQGPGGESIGVIENMAQGVPQIATGSMHLLPVCWF